MGNDQTSGSEGGKTGQVADATKTGTGGVDATAGKTGQTAQTETGKAKQNPTILEGSVEHLRNETEGDEGKGAEHAATWPEDWREQASGGNEKVLGLLKRYGSVNGVAAALASLRTRLDNGDFKKGLGKDATEDEIAQHRKDNGIPDKPEDYALPEGLTIEGADKPIVDEFLKFAHQRNQTPQQVQETINWYFQAREQENQQKYDADNQYREEQEDTLRTELGREFKGFHNALRNFVPSFFGKELGAALMGARLGDGTLAGNNGAFLKKMYDFARHYAPEHTLTDAGAGGSEKSVDARIAEIEKVMSTDREGYYKDQRMQDEYLELMRTKEKIAERNKKAA